MDCAPEWAPGRESSLRSAGWASKGSGEALHLAVGRHVRARKLPLELVWIKNHPDDGSTSVYCSTDEKCRLRLDLQFVMLNISGIVLIPKIIIEAAGTGESYLTWAVFAGLCVCGAVNILQSVRVGRMGAGYILLMGTSGTFVAFSVTALTEGVPLCWPP